MQVQGSLRGDGGALPTTWPRRKKAQISSLVLVVDPSGSMQLFWLLALSGAVVGIAQCPDQTTRLVNLTSFPHYDQASRPLMGTGLPVNVSFPSRSSLWLSVRMNFV